MKFKSLWIQEHRGPDHDDDDDDDDDDDNDNDDDDARLHG